MGKLQPTGPKNGSKHSSLPNTAACLGLDVGEQPAELQGLNVYERILCQPIKQFVTVISLKTRSTRVNNGPAIRALRGMGITLPLELTETQKWVVNLNILVR
jgi:hypothetical protein